MTNQPQTDGSPEQMLRLWILAYFHPSRHQMVRQDFPQSRRESAQGIEPEINLRLAEEF